MRVCLTLFALFLFAFVSGGCATPEYLKHKSTRKSDATVKKPMVGTPLAKTLKLQSTTLSEAAALLGVPAIHQQNESQTLLVYFFEFDPSQEVEPNPLLPNRRFVMELAFEADVLADLKVLRLK